MKNCIECEHYHKSKISYMDNKCVITEFGISIGKCKEKIRILLIKDNYTNMKFKGPNGIIGKTKDFDYKGKYEDIVDKISIDNCEGVPKWCPLKMKKLLK